MACKSYKWIRTRDEPKILASLKDTRSLVETAKVFGVHSEALRNLLNRWGSDYRRLLGEDHYARALTKEQVHQLAEELRESRAEALTGEKIKRFVEEARATPMEEPDWVLRPRNRKPSDPGIPVLFVSDEHVGEVVKPSQVAGKNEYNLEIAQGRYQRLTQKFLELSFRYAPGLANPHYPGAVVVFGGDGVSGTIHEELVATNEQPIMPCVLALRDWRVAMLRAFLAEFGHLFVVGVAGNHARTTKRIISKDMVYGSFDWLCMQFVARAFEGDKRVHFLIPDGLDARFRLYGLNYVASHGYEQKGGDGMIGAIGPITRGDMKRRARDAGIDLAYHVALSAHYHQYMPGRTRIVNGSLIGYNEYAYQQRFAYEPPIQAGWISHPELGITYQFPVFVEPPKPAEKTPWISWVK